MLRKGDRLRVQGVGTPLLDDTERAMLSGAAPIRTIAYTIRICCPDGKH